MKIATWNVNSIGARLPLVLKWLAGSKPEIVCLQEIKCIDRKFPAADIEALGYHAVTHGQPTYNGVAILSLLPFDAVTRGFPDDDDSAQSRAIHARITHPVVGTVDVLNLYIPNGSEVGSDKYAYKLDWLKRLRAYLDGAFDPTAQVLICGDFNVATEDRDIHDPAAWTGQVLCSEPERTALARIAEWGLTDAYRQHHVEGGHFTWWDYRQGAFRRNAGLRIDHIWLTQSLAARCAGAWIDRETRTWERPSDHAPVVVELT